MMVVENFGKREKRDGIESEYFYRVIRGNISLPVDGNDIEVQSYGIEIERQDIVGERIVSIERDCINNISPHRYKVHNLMKMLYENTVSPIHLVEILGEYIDEYIIDFDDKLKDIEAIN